MDYLVVTQDWYCSCRGCKTEWKRVVGYNRRAYLNLGGGVDMGSDGTKSMDFGPEDCPTCGSAGLEKFHRSRIEILDGVLAIAEEKPVGS